MPKGDSTVQKPLEAIHNSLEKMVMVEIKGNREFKGILIGYDIHMNLVLEDVEEMGEGESRKLGRVVVRGDNVILISPSSG
jgi:small nuclear ribonucleoprotein